jgi:hypothetical protein
MKKEIWLVIILGIIVVILAGVLLWPAAKPSGIKVTSPNAKQEIFSPIKITGIVSGNGWAGFEGQVGTVKLVDVTGNEIVSGILTATTQWTTLPTNFETT